MDAHEFEVSLLDLVATLSKTMDMMSAAVADHQMTVAYLAFRLCQELDLPTEERRDIAVAGALHDIGAFSLNDRLDLLEFEDDKPGEHSMAGYLLLKDFGPFEKVAPLIKYHHVPWEHGTGGEKDGEPVARGNHVLHLMDRVAVLIPKDKCALTAVPRICETITERSGEVFVPEFVEAALHLAKKDYVWLEVSSGTAEHVLRKELAEHTQKLDMDGLLAFSRLICKVIDFKSVFTATHSRGVAATALQLAQVLGFSEVDCRKMEVAAYLHDLGKLAVPLEILEKPAKLTDEEWPIMRSHVFYSYQALEAIETFSTITLWSTLHHERLNGTGYPFGYRGEGIPVGARVMAVADVFTGITEDRPYREGMAGEQAQSVLEDMAARGELDGEIVQTLLDHFEEFDEVRAQAQEIAAGEYREFRAALS